MTTHDYSRSIYHRAWFRRSNIPPRFQGWGRDDLDKYPGDIAEWIDDVIAGKVIKNPGGLGETGVGLLLYGPPGLGKTTLACVVLQDLIWKINPENGPDVLKLKGGSLPVAMTPVYYTTYPEMVAFVKKGFEDPSIGDKIEGLYGRATDDLLNVRVLVLDDLGKEYQTDFTDATIDEVVRSRYDRGLPTIITTNVPLRKWGTQYGSAMGSFANEAFWEIPMTGRDRRVDD